MEGLNWASAKRERRENGAVDAPGCGSMRTSFFTGIPAARILAKKSKSALTATASLLKGAHAERARGTARRSAVEYSVPCCGQRGWRAGCCFELRTMRTSFFTGIPAAGIPAEKSKCALSVSTSLFMGEDGGGGHAPVWPSPVPST